MSSWDDTRHPPVVVGVEDLRNIHAEMISAIKFDGRPNTGKANLIKDTLNTTVYVGSTQFSELNDALEFAQSVHTKYDVLDTLISQGVSFEVRYHGFANGYDREYRVIKLNIDPREVKISAYGYSKWKNTALLKVGAVLQNYARPQPSNMARFANLGGLGALGAAGLALGFLVSPLAVTITPIAVVSAIALEQRRRKQLLSVINLLPSIPRHQDVLVNVVR